MSDDSSSKITQLLTSFESFIKLIEDPEWPRASKNEDIKTAFKLGNSVEKTVEHFKTQNSIDQFFKVLKKWLRNKGRMKVYKADMYAVACDEILNSFFSCPNISENNLDIAVRVYTSMFSKQRFEEALTKYLLKAGNIEALREYIETAFSNDDLKCFSYHLQLRNWSSLLQRGESIGVKGEIQDMLTPYNVETFLHILIGVLSLSDISDEEKVVQDIILDSVLVKMSERTILTKQLWITMLKTIESKTVCAACENIKEFLDSFLNFIFYIGSMMKKVGSFWNSDANICFYPEITYEDISSYLYKLYNINSNIKQAVISRLNDVKEYSDTDIWDEILSYK